ncbi:MAG TPA: hypothetical protein VF267_05030 [Gammaproteobacteria bacterium]
MQSSQTVFLSKAGTCPRRLPAHEANAAGNAAWFAISLVIPLALAAAVFISP